MSRTTKETKLAKDLLNWFDELIEQGKPIYYEHRSGSGGFNYHRGVPDLFIVIGETHIECELKAPDGKLSGDQEKFRWKCERRGTPYLCPRTLDEAKGYIKKVLEERTPKL